MCTGAAGRGRRGRAACRAGPTSALCRPVSRACTHSPKVSSEASTHTTSLPCSSLDLSGCSGSWRAVAIFFIVLTIAMAATLAFVAASSLASGREEEAGARVAAQACAVLETSGEQEGSPVQSPRGPGMWSTVCFRKWKPRFPLVGGLSSLASSRGCYVVLEKSLIICNPLNISSRLVNIIFLDKYALNSCL